MLEPEMAVERKRKKIAAIVATRALTERTRRK
jgi:hypothetical protein